MIDPLTRLCDLQWAEPTPERADRIRRRCRAELARQARASESRVTQRKGSRLWTTAAASLCVAYVVEMIALAAEVLQSR